MNKLAHAEMLGRDFASRIFLNAETEGLEKAASNNEEVDADYVSNLDSMMDEIQFRDYQQKIAHNNGALSVLAKVAQALEGGVDANALYSEIDGAMHKIASELPLAEDEDEADNVYASMVKGAAEMFGHLYNTEVDEDVIKIAAAQIDEAFSDLSEDSE